jgi:hypothetical protein
VVITRLPAYPAGLMVRPFVSQLAEEFRQAIAASLQGNDLLDNKLDHPCPTCRSDESLAWQAAW